MQSNEYQEYPEYAAPSYEESISSPPPLNNQDSKTSLPLSHNTPQAPLPSHLTETRTQRISSILSTYIDPLLISQGSSGLYKTTFLLVASNDPTLQPQASSYSTPKEPEVIGFPSDEIVKIVRLKGEENNLEFWRQPPVVAELESALKSRLAASGHRLEQPAGEYNPLAPHSPTPDETHDASKKPESKSFWGRSRDKLRSSEAFVVDRKLGWRAEEPREDNTPKGKVPTGLVRVVVSWKPVSTRVENEMGLYETKNGTGLCISIEVGS
ncbi:hypothetical protein FQN54_000843 [Arachnomyces sp. PD_36]|nr:hypothetical protein FQN54_000843 [Arachnomyces sp. PD_36]